VGREVTCIRDGFGLANIVALAGRAGLDVALAPHDGLRFALNADMVTLTFTATARPRCAVWRARPAILGATAMFVVRY
jgi:hypothetical protein